DPRRGVAAADRLRKLVPGSGHLVHMPAHIYARVGRWHDAVVANQRAIEADDAYLALCRGNSGGVYPLGYVPHNHHFLWFAASMEGSGEVAQAAARNTGERANLQDLMREPGYAGLQHYWLTPWFDNVRFGRWDLIEGADNPAPDLPYVTAIWHYARAMAAVRRQRLDEADAHLAALRPLAADPAMDQLMVWDRYPLAHAARIAERTVTAELAAARGQVDGAVAALEEAVAIEDASPYDEPPGWHAPVRQALGAVLLDGGRGTDAGGGGGQGIVRTCLGERRRHPGLVAALAHGGVAPGWPARPGPVSRRRRRGAAPGCPNPVAARNARRTSPAAPAGAPAARRCRFRGWSGSDRRGTARSRCRRSRRHRAGRRPPPRLRAAPRPPR